MTNEQLFEEMKQLVDAKFAQEREDFATKDDLKDFATKDDLQHLATKDDLTALERRIDELDDKIDLIHNNIAEYMSERDAAVRDTLKDHDGRIRRLESRAA